ncbi:transporter [Vibrio sp. ZSDZ34]|jgi:hypothetical protein|uniref:Transporter n=1 Tax=Vibrio gelatinilyticus TaxID=2893468 RepID=A0A9X1WB94_9VIBR|nr:transporter [Vibrio gelatinilyticus]MCJ2377418.1 transporter [Vibrio gelatinilyticus]
MQSSEITEAVFDYTSFLGESSSQKWTFVDALSSIAPIFSTVWDEATKDVSDPNARLWDMAMKSLSSRRSDESNLVTLIKIARHENIERVQLMMPYSLEPEQIDVIQEKTKAKIVRLQADDFLISI